MALVSPLRGLHLEAEALMTPYGPGVVRVDESGVAVEVVEGFGDIELEYSAVRKHAAVLDQPNRAVIEVRGTDRLEFLNRMVTQELKGVGTGSVRRSFWLNKKGRIDGDLTIIELGDRTLIELDVHAMERTLRGLSSYVVMEDVGLRNLTDETHVLGVFGPGTAGVLGALVGAEAPLPRAGEAAVVEVFGASCVVVGDDATGEAGCSLIVPVERAREVFERLLTLGGAGRSCRAIGWHAYNIARIEAGTALYNIDFGPESLPAETGVLRDRVSFTKGCYLGQEVVARMHARKQSRQALVGIRFEASEDPRTHAPRQPVTGMTLVIRGTAGDVSGAAIGVVTSSTISPMLGAIPIAFAQVKSAFANSGTSVGCEVGGEWIRGEVIEGLAFWRRG